MMGILIHAKRFLMGILLDSDASGGKKEAKGGTAVKVRHILCEKHGKVMEAMEKLKAGNVYICTLFAHIKRTRHDNNV